ncbi:DM13 domain-containing protein [Bythopirellula goksoeyrii]|uniref:Electron transfer DM13 n=1 Tax=Bythopirellula goksoeyrii TaxID=1400387 RepID=A0A5B9QBE5_9BACT|nr:DM13 domain-containing protein [Bythopirellula goksoeyrii]QEG34832.1 Electron transfer DM13 [Bythopirellula goksoeyrii]
MRIILTSCFLLESIAFYALQVSDCQAQLTSPQIGWQAQLSELAHDVSGTVTILDEDSIQVDNFTYDGGGIVVKFYLGTEDSQSAFTMGTPIGFDLFGTSYDGTQAPLIYDLPTGNTLEGLNAISVWCVAANANFGSGTFAPVLTADFDEDGDVDGQDFLIWQRGEGSGVGLEDWQNQYGDATAGVLTVPEPSNMILTAMIVCVITLSRAMFS